LFAGQNHYHLVIETQEGKLSQRQTSAPEPSPNELFAMEKGKDQMLRNEAIEKGYPHHSCTLQQIAQYLRVYYAAVTRGPG
jgi:hypothetical protein